MAGNIPQVENAVYYVRGDIRQLSDTGNLGRLQQAWNTTKQLTTGLHNLQSEAGRVEDIMNYQGMYTHFTQNTAQTLDQYCIMDAPDVGRPWATKSKDMLMEHIEIFTHQDPSFRQFDIVMTGKEFMFPFGIDRNFPLEKTVICMEGQVSRNCRTCTHDTVTHK
jgi:hypothetical protein